MNDDQLLRYSRHILLDEIGIEAQERLLASRMLVVGAGGLGSPAALYLAAAGVGTLMLADDDTVDLTNLQRQILHRQDRIGMAKTESARLTLASLNPDVQFVPLPRLDTDAALDEAVSQADVVLDGSDNFATRQTLNRACVAAAKPLVSGAAARFDGQLAVYRPDLSSSPCYACLFDDGQADDGACALFGVFSPLVGVIGSMQAAEALKILLGTEPQEYGRLHVYNALSGRWQSFALTKNRQCRVCGPKAV